MELSRRRHTKKKRLQDGGSLSLQDGQDLQAQNNVKQQLQDETRQNSSRTKGVEIRRRRCRTCGEPGHNSRTCQNDIESSEEDNST